MISDKLTMRMRWMTRKTEHPDPVAHAADGEIQVWDMKALEEDGGDPPPGFLRVEIGARP